MNNLFYNIGVDIGVGSVGYCVTDENGKVVRRNGKNLIGSRIFDEGKPAKDTRMYRGQRRRYTRRRQRIAWLQELLKDDVLQKDENFYMKLKERNLVEEDKSDFGDFSEILDKNLVKRMKAYKSIYHLRNRLVTDSSKEDIRLVYLAIHHIIKYRGNFLYQGREIKPGSETVTNLIEGLRYFDEYSEMADEEIRESAEKIKEVMFDKKITKRNAKKQIETILRFEDEHKAIGAQLAALLSGSSFAIDGIFSTSVDKKFTVGDEDLFAEVEGSLDSEQYEALMRFADAYSGKILSDILSDRECKKEYKYISEAMIGRYNEHSQDLELLKELYSSRDIKNLSSASGSNAPSKKPKNAESVKKYGERYIDMFDRTDGLYAKYIKNPSSLKTSSKSAYEVFVDRIKADLDIDEKQTYSDRRKQAIRERLFNRTLLLRQNEKDNGAIPYQLHKAELVKIIENQGQYYPSLKANAEKIVAILEYKIPYYIGPVGGESRFKWSLKKANEKIYPWTFNDVIDKDASAERFITRMTGKCSYLRNEDVLPKNSLLYSEYEVRSEIKQIKFDGKFLSVDLQNDLFEEVFKKYKTVKENRLRSWAKTKGLSPKSITGYQKDKEFASSFTSYIDFTRILGNISHSDVEMVENIISWLTIFNEKDIIEKRIRTHYPALDEKQIESILRLKYTGWGKLSRKLLTGLKSEDSKGVNKSIMDYLRSSKKFFMQIINDKDLSFKKQIEEANSIYDYSPLSYKAVDELRTSPANKRAIWQSILVIKEITKIMGREPANIYIEFAREEGEKDKRTVSRYDSLVKMFKDNEEYAEILDDLKSRYANNKKALADDRLFLYYIQNAKCMYSGKRLHIEELKEYEVDHILPQSYIKDDSLDNKALVIRSENQRKRESMLLNEDVQKMRPWWKRLKDMNLISQKKYDNLVRESLSEETAVKFVARQLVETRQIILNVTNLLQAGYPKTYVSAVRADVTSNLRKRFDLPKIRNLNDYHHGFDAFLTVYAGIYISKAFPSLEKELIYGEYRKYISKSKNDRKSKYGFVVGKIDELFVDKHTGEVTWDGRDVFDHLSKVYRYKDYLVSHKTEKQTGKFYDETVYPKERGKSLIPLKSNLSTEKYGGYSGQIQAYYAVVEYKEKDKTVKKLIGIPVRIDYLEKTKPGSIAEYISEVCRTSEFEILKDNIYKYQKIFMQGQELYIVSDNEVTNAVQMVLPLTLARTFNKAVTEPLSVDDSEYAELFEYIKEKTAKLFPLYSGIVKKYENAKSDFETMTKENKLKFLQQMLVVTSPSSSNGKFDSIIKSENENNNKITLGKLGAREGRTAGKTIKIGETVFVDNSVTGYYSKKTKYIYN